MTESPKSWAVGARARDLDRVAAMSVLDNAMTDGQLAPTEYRERTELARDAATVGQLAELVADLQSPDPMSTRQVPTPSGHRTGVLLGVVGTLLVLAVIVAIAAAVGIFPGQNVTTGNPVSSSESVAVDNSIVNGTMLTADGIRGLVSTTRERFGTTTAMGVHIYRDSATLFVADPTSTSGSVHYDYSPGGEFHSPQNYGGLSVSATGSPDVTVDLTLIDVDAVADLIASAPERLGIANGAAGRVPFRVTIGGDDGGEIWMGVNDISLDSHLVAGLDGAIKGIHRCSWGC